MIQIKDNEARKDIEWLTKELRELRARLCYYTDAQKRVAEHSIFAPCGTALNATEIVSRFEELYALLGVDRKTTPESTSLVKVEKGVAQ